MKNVIGLFLLAFLFGCNSNQDNMPGYIVEQIKAHNGNEEWNSCVNGVYMKNEVVGSGASSYIKQSVSNEWFYQNRKCNQSIISKR
jgi:hypothetical protein